MFSENKNEDEGSQPQAEEALEKSIGRKEHVLVTSLFVESSTCAGERYQNNHGRGNMWAE